MAVDVAVFVCVVVTKAAASVRENVVAAVVSVMVLPLLFLVRRSHCEDKSIRHRHVELDRSLLSCADLELTG